MCDNNLEHNLDPLLLKQLAAGDCWLLHAADAVFGTPAIYGLEENAISGLLEISGGEGPELVPCQSVHQQNTGFRRSPQKRVSMARVAPRCLKHGTCAFVTRRMSLSRTVSTTTPLSLLQADAHLAVPL